MRHYAHNVGDYAAATRHLSFVEDAAYRRLLDRYYQDEKPLPVELSAVQRLAGARNKEERSAVEAVLHEYFTLEDDGWHQARADREISIYREKAESARRNGTKGGRPANQRKTNTVVPPVREEKLTTPHYPLPDSVPNGTGAKAPIDALWSEGLAWLIEQTTKSRDACAKMIGGWLKAEHDNADIVWIKLQEAMRAGTKDPYAFVVARLPSHTVKARESWNDERIRRGKEVLAS